MSTAEKRTGLIFALTALAWITRRGFDLGSLGEVPGWATLLGMQDYVHDSTVAVAAMVALFLVPAGGNGGRLLDSAALRRIPWHILVLFGGGFALARGFTVSGLDQALAQGLTGMGSLPLPLALYAICLGVSLLTEVNSNTATATTLLPLVAAAAPALGLPVAPVLLAVTLSASCAFMLPTATAPNAIVFAAGAFTLKRMAALGLVMNILAAMVIAMAAWMARSLLA